MKHIVRRSGRMGTLKKIKENKTLTEQIYDELKSAIIELELKPGEIRHRRVSGRTAGRVENAFEICHKQADL